MRWIGSILKWRDHRYKLAQLQFYLEDIDASFKSKVVTEKLKRGTDKWDDAYGSYQNELDLTYSEIGELETQMLVSRAKSWGVPIPSRPISEEPVYDDPHWWWSQVHHRYYLTDEGKARLRREAYAEMEMFYKPWLSWLAVLISVLSLIISVLR